MKSQSIIATAILLFLSALTNLHSQAVDPNSINFGGVPVGYTSKAINVSFKNTGNASLTVTESITGPFAMPVNKCGRGVKPGTHCNVDVTYIPAGLETDTGSLTFNYTDGAGQGSVSVSLSGYGNNGYPTESHLKIYPNSVCTPAQITFTMQVTSKDGKIQDGEQVYVACNWVGWRGQMPFTLTNGEAIWTSTWYGNTHGAAQCWINYDGDSEFAPSQSTEKNINLDDQC